MKQTPWAESSSRASEPDDLAVETKVALSQGDNRRVCGARNE